MASAAEIQLDEAIRLGLVPDEVIRRLHEQGVLESPFIPGRLAARQTPFWRLPRLLRAGGPTPRAAMGQADERRAVPQRGAVPGLRRVAARGREGLVQRRLEDEADFGLWDPRFGLGPLEFDFPLSPPAPAFMGGRSPVGRAAARGTQAPAPVETLLGQGNLAEIARRIEEGFLDPSRLSPAVLAAVAPLLRASAAGRVARSAPTPTARKTLAAAPAPASGGAVRTALSAAKQAAGLGRLAGGLFAEPPSHALSLDSQAAFEAQRAGERLAAPGGGEGPAESTVSGEFTPEMAAALEQFGGFGGAPDLIQWALATGNAEFLPQLTSGELTPEMILAQRALGVSPTGIPGPAGPLAAPPQGTFFEEGTLAPPEFGPPRGSAPPPLPPSLGDALFQLELEAAAAEALRTGNASALPTGPDGQLTPEAVQALADASAGAGGGPAQGGDGRVVDFALAQRLADQAARAGGSAVPGSMEAETPSLPTWEPGMGPVAVPAAEIPSGAEAVETPTWELTPTGAEALETPEVLARGDIGRTLGGIGAGLGAAAQLAGGAQALAEGRTGPGAIQVAQAAAKAAELAGLAPQAINLTQGIEGAAPFDIPVLSTVFALANIGMGFAQGDQAGERQAVRAAMAAIPYIGWVMSIGLIISDLIQMGLSEYKQGDLSKRIMNAKQQHFAQYGNQATTEAIRTAPDFAAAIRSLSAAPPGTSGQVQFGVGETYAGMSLVGQGGTTESPEWQKIIAGVAHPGTLAEHPDLVAGFIQNLWVQTGPSGAASFNPAATRDYQTYLLSKLPNTPEWLTAKQKLLASEPVDPRDPATRDRAMAAAPDLPVEPGFLRVNGLRLPVDHRYQSYDGASGITYDSSPERLAQVLTPWGSGNVFDQTTGRWMGVGGEPRAALDPTYLDREAMQTPWFRAQAERQATQWRERMQPPTVEGWSGENWGSMPNPQYDPSFDAPFAAVQRFLAAPRAEPAAAPEPEMPAPTATQVPVPSAATAAPTPEPATPPPPPPAAPPPAPIPLPTVSATEMPAAAPPDDVLAQRLIEEYRALIQQIPGGYTPEGINATLISESHVSPERAAQLVAGLNFSPPEPYPSLQQGGAVPKTGLYRLHQGERVMPTVVPGAARLAALLALRRRRFETPAWYGAPGVPAPRRDLARPAGQGLVARAGPSVVGAGSFLDPRVSGPATASQGSYNKFGVFQWPGERVENFGGTEGPLWGPGVLPSGAVEPLGYHLLATGLDFPSSAAFPRPDRPERHRFRDLDEAKQFVGLNLALFGNRAQTAGVPPGHMPGVPSEMVEPLAQQVFNTGLDFPQVGLPPRRRGFASMDEARQFVGLNPSLFGTTIPFQGPVYGAAPEASDVPPPPLSGTKPPPPPSLQQGGLVPRTGVYRLHEGEVVVPADAEGAPRARSEPMPEGRWYLHPRRGVPFEAGSNPEPGRVWRLAFNAEQLYDAWSRRGKDGFPLLVPASVTTRRDWPQVAERARRTQYMGVHPAVLLARAVAPDEMPGQVEGLEADQRFGEGVWEERTGLRNPPPVPQPEPTPPMRQMPPGRQLTPEERRGVRWPGAPA